MNNQQTTQSYPFIIYKGCLYQFKDEMPKDATILNAPNIDTAMGYVSEEYLNKMLAEKEKEIEILRQGEKVLIDSLQILSGMVKNK